MPRTPREAKADPANFGFELFKTYPLPEPPKVPSHTSDELKRFFTQAANALKRGDWDASGAMSRKVVDVSTQQLLGDEAKKFGTIEKRIDQLAKTGKITTDLQEWAHQIRLGGNEASHDEIPYTEPEAAELLDFADLYLTYVYTLPGRLKDRKERAAAKKKAAEDASTSKTKAAGEEAVPA